MKGAFLIEKLSLFNSNYNRKKGNTRSKLKPQYQFGNRKVDEQSKNIIACCDEWTCG